MTELQNNAKDLVKALSTLRRIRSRLNPYCDLNYGEMSVFAAVMKLKDISEKDALIQMAEISREMDISKPALSQIVNKLEDKGLVERVFTKEDRRATYLTFTAQGTAIYNREKKRMAEMVNAITKNMGDEDTEKFIQLLYKFSSVVEDYKKSHCNQGE